MHIRVGVMEDHPLFFSLKFEVLRPSSSPCSILRLSIWCISAIFVIVRWGQKQALEVLCGRKAVRVVGSFYWLYIVGYFACT